jgi:hypothetical protein
MSRKIYVITTVGFDNQLLPKFLQYYSLFNPKNILIIVNDSKDSDLFENVKNICKSYKHLCILQEWDEGFSEDGKLKQERLLLSKHVKSHNDWIVYADLDEFQQYPKNIRASIKNAERIGFDYLEGRMIDRISITGKLDKFCKTIPLEMQYSIGGFITKELLKGWDKKIVCAKANRILGGGHHVFINHNGVYFNGHKTETYYEEMAPHSFGIKIHHFKWNSFTVEKLKKELTFGHESLKAWREEHIRFIKYIEENGNFDISNPCFKFQYYGKQLGI